MRPPRLPQCERGFVSVEFAMGVGLLLLPVLVLVATLPTWIERQSMARVAAREAARAVALADTWEQGTTAARATASAVAQNHGLAPEDLTLAVTGSLARDDSVTVAVTVRYPATNFPGFGSVGAFSWTTRHTEKVDAYRSFR